MDGEGVSKCYTTETVRASKQLLKGLDGQINAFKLTHGSAGRIQQEDG